MTHLFEDWDQLLQEQERMEDESLGQGARRFRRRLQQAREKGRESTVGAGKKLLARALDPVEEEMTGRLELKKRGRRHVAEKWVKEIGVDVAAYIGVKTLLDKTTESTTLNSAAVTISGLILDELRYRRFKEQEPKLYDYKLRNFKTNSYAHMSRSLDASMRFAGVDVEHITMTPTQRVSVGAWVIDCVITATGLFEQTVKKKKNGRRWAVTSHIEATEATLEWMDKRNEVLELAHPVCLPMVVPPLPWGPGLRGGYRYALKGRHPMIRSHRGSRQPLEQESRDLPLVFGTLNRLQETPWRVNGPVLDLVRMVVEKGGGVAGVPGTEQEALPPKPHDIDENEEARKRWRKAASKVRDRNHVAKLEALRVSRVVALGKKLRDLDAFFFPYSLDFRGRVYPIADFLSPQGDDIQKGMLTFAQGEALGGDGKRWLEIHLCNCLGVLPDGRKVSRMPLEDRVQWVQENAGRLSRLGEEPRDDLLWQEADEPFQFFAACREYHHLDLHCRAGGSPETFVSSLPVSLDGSCNGLQHFAALLRDEHGARAVNVTPNGRPEDVYSEVADAVLGFLEQDVQGEDDEADLAARWLRSGLVDRKLTKRPTMTFGYGSKAFGFRGQIIAEMVGRENWLSELKPIFYDGVEDRSLLGKGASYMATLIWRALELRVSGAFQGMEWLQQAARTVAKGGRVVSWTVPLTELQVEQPYWVQKIRQVDTTIAGKLVRPSVYENTPEIALHKQANGIAPNVIHSLDAAALMLTVTMAASQGLTSFAMVHDSYGTTAGSMGVLAHTTRQEFFRLYTSVDVLEHLRADFQVLTEEEVPAPPQAGDLDLSGVLASEYFFA